MYHLTGVISKENPEYGRCARFIGLICNDAFQMAERRGCFIDVHSDAPITASKITCLWVWQQPIHVFFSDFGPQQLHVESFRITARIFAYNAVIDVEFLKQSSTNRRTEFFFSARLGVKKEPQHELIVAR